MAPMNFNQYNPAQLLSLSGTDVRAFFGGDGYETRVPGVPLFTTDINSQYDPNTTFVLNPGAWTTPGPGQFGTGSPYYNDYRYRRVPSENMSLARIFRVREGMDLQLRVELQNVFNRTHIPNPFSSLTLPQLTTPTGAAYSGFGYSNAINAGGERTAQIVARFNF
jgi:hypothetical protein